MNPVFVVLIFFAATVSLLCALWIVMDIDPPAREHLDQYERWFWYLAAPALVVLVITFFPFIVLYHFFDWITEKGTK